MIAGANFNSPGNCTSGFSGTVNGVQGFLTATHCRTNRSYIDHLSNNLIIDKSAIITNNSTAHELSFVPTPQWQIYGGSYESDFIYKPGVPISNDTLKVKGGADEFIFIDGTRLQGQPPVAGTYLCHFGLATGYSCGYVTAIESINTKPPGSPLPNGGGCNSKFSPSSSIYSQNCASTYYRMEGPDLACSNGDSGGPVFRRPSSTSKDIKAFGIATSAVFTSTAKGACVAMWYSPLYYAENDYGFKLKTEF